MVDLEAESSIRPLCVVHVKYAFRVRLCMDAWCSRGNSYRRNRQKMKDIELGPGMEIGIWMGLRME